VKGKHDAHAADALLATVARHLAKADAVARKAVLEAVFRLAEEPNGRDHRGICRRDQHPASERRGAPKRGAVMNALPRSLGPSIERAEDEPSDGSDQVAVSIALNKRIHKGRSRNTGRARNSHTGMGRNHNSDAQPRWPRFRR
jgi:hypothetical protein